MCKNEKSLLRPEKCEILDIEELTASEKLFRLRLENRKELGHRPGQFVQVSFFGLYEAPISICSSPTRKGYFELGIRKTGELTDKLHHLKAGDSVSIRGPFGSYFDHQLLSENDLIIVAGGCGLFPLRSLIQYCEDSRQEFGKITILYGTRSPETILFNDDITKWRKSSDFDLELTVDTTNEKSNYCDNVGLITELIPPLAINPEKTVAVVVGPPIMYRAVIDQLKNKGLSDYQILVSLERYMRCGYGKCGHCRIGHLYCCVDGPVFWLNEIARVEGAI